MPPDNTGYMVAAYVVTTVILAGYAWGLWRRAMRALRNSGTAGESSGS